MASSQDRRVVLVVGAGRSGTSTVTGVLRRLGLHVPQPEVLTDETNPKGFGEPRWVVDLHDQLLARAGVQVSDARPVAWSKAAALAQDDALVGRVSAWLGDELSGHPRLIVKDPRLAWFLPVWEAAVRDRGAEPAYLTMLRPPPEVVGSKRTYYNQGLADAQGIAAWLNTLLGTERATRGADRVLLRYHDLLEDWEPSARGVAEHLRLPCLLDAVEPARADLDAFVDPGLRRIELGFDDLALPERLRDLTVRTWTALDALAETPGDPGAQADLDVVREEYAAYYLEAELVTRSTVIAERRAVRAALTGSPEPTGEPRPAAAAPLRPTPRGRARAALGRAVRRVPEPLRRRVPESLRRRVLDAADRTAR